MHLCKARNMFHPVFDETLTPCGGLVPLKHNGTVGQLVQTCPAKRANPNAAPVLTKYGRQEGTQKDHNPTKRGRRGFHPLLAVAAGTRLCASYQFRPGDTVTSTQKSAQNPPASLSRAFRLGQKILGTGHAFLSLVISRREKLLCENFQCIAETNDGFLEQMCPLPTLAR